MCDKMAISAYILKIVEKDPFLRLQMRAEEMVKVQCLKVFCYHGNKSTILPLIQFLDQLLFTGLITLQNLVQQENPSVQL